MSAPAPSPDLLARAAGVKLLVLDVDGVLTDGGLYYGPQGEALKRFGVRDGHGLVMARLAGLPAALLTARSSSMVEIRARELNLAAVFQGRYDKGVALRELCDSLQVKPDDCAYMGDDTNDLGPLSQVRLACCPQDAVDEVRRVAHFVARSPGGHGAVRELVELCLKARGAWAPMLERMASPDPTRG